MVVLLIIVLLVIVLIGVLGVLCWWLWGKGPRGRAGAIALLCIVCGALLVVYLRDRAAVQRIEALKNSLDAGLHADLAVGDSSEKIERVLTTRNLEGTYDSVLGGYVFSVHTERPDARLVVEIKVDEAKKLKTIHVTLHFIYI